MALNIKKYPLDASNYFQDDTTSIKDQIWLHHTISNGKPHSDIDYWNKLTERFATAYVIGRDGKILQAFHEKYWAYHLGIGNVNNADKRSIGIELCNFGAVELNQNNEWVASAYDEEIVIPSNEVIALNEEFRGNFHYHKYSQAQLKAMKELVLALAGKYGIDNVNVPTQKQDFQFQSSKSSSSGVHTHVNVRQYGKNDLHPQQELFNTLNNISNSSPTNNLPDYDNIPKEGDPKSSDDSTTNQGKTSKENTTENTKGNKGNASQHGDIDDGTDTSINTKAIFQQIEKGLNNVEKGEVRVGWGQRLNEEEESDWIGLKQFLIYLTTKYMPQGFFPFVELIPSYNIEKTVDMKVKGDIDDSLYKDYANRNSRLNTPTESFKDADALNETWKGGTLNSDTKKGASNIDDRRWNNMANLYNSDKRIDLFNVDPYGEKYSELNELNEAGKDIKRVRGYGVRIYEQSVFSPAPIDGNQSKPGAVGFNSFKVEAGNSSYNAMTSISMDVVDIQGNRFVDPASPWAFMFDVRTKTAFGYFFLRYGWQLRLPDPKSNSTIARKFWNHEGWEIFGNDVKEKVKQNLNPSMLVTLTHSNSLESIFKSEIVKDDGQIVVNKDLIKNSSDYMSVAIRPPEMSVDDQTGAITATLNFWAAGSYGTFCNISNASQTKSLVKKGEDTNLATFMEAVDYDNRNNSVQPIEDPDRKKNINKINKEKNESKAGNTNNLVRVVGMYANSPQEKTGNIGQSIDPNTIDIEFTNMHVKRITKENETGESLISFVRDVLEHNNCQLLSAANGSGAVNAAYGVTTTQKPDKNAKKQEEEERELIKDSSEVFVPRSSAVQQGQSSIGRFEDVPTKKRENEGTLNFGGDVDVFSYRFQGTLVESIDISESDSPNILKNKINHELPRELTEKKKSYDNGEIKGLTQKERERFIMLMLARMINVNITVLAHPWITPLDTIFVKGTGGFDGKYMVLSANHELDSSHKFVTEIEAVRMFSSEINKDKNMKDTKKNDKSDMTGGGDDNFTKNDVNFKSNKVNDLGKLENKPANRDNTRTNGINA